MCHGTAAAAFPAPAAFEAHSREIQALRFDGRDPHARIAILPDIYGCNPFYQGLATRLANRGATVFLVDTFAGLGDLPTSTREAAFERRHRLRDREYVDAFESFARREQITGVIGFCLGGLFVFELARRALPCALVAFYPFPQGLQNQDPVDVPFDYLPTVRTPHLVLVGDADASLGADHLRRLRSVAADNPALTLKVFEQSGHGFLADLDSADPRLRLNAERALAACEAHLGLGAAVPKASR